MRKRSMLHTGLAEAISKDQPLERWAAVDLDFRISIQLVASPLCVAKNN